MARAPIALTTLLLAGPASLAMAAEAEHGGSAGNPFAGDIGNALWTLIVFALVVWVLGKFAWGPILKALQDRESFIRESLEAAKRDRDAAEARLKEYEERLAHARSEASAIVEEGRRDADVLKRKLEESGRVEADKMIERAKREIQIAKDTATKEIYTLSARLATDMAAKLIGRELSAPDHARLIGEAIESMGKTETN
jgi:F-type H+-transporting ATPase subunit b